MLKRRRFLQASARAISLLPGVERVTCRAFEQECKAWISPELPQAAAPRPCRPPPRAQARVTAREVQSGGRNRQAHAHAARGPRPCGRAPAPTAPGVSQAHIDLKESPLVDPARVDQTGEHDEADQRSLLAAAWPALHSPRMPPGPQASLQPGVPDPERGAADQQPTLVLETRSVGRNRSRSSEGRERSLDRRPASISCGGRGRRRDRQSVTLDIKVVQGEGRGCVGSTTFGRSATARWQTPTKTADRHAIDVDRRNTVNVTGGGQNTVIRGRPHARPVR